MKTTLRKMWESITDGFSRVHNTLLKNKITKIPYIMLIGTMHYLKWIIGFATFIYIIYLLFRFWVVTISLFVLLCILALLWGAYEKGMEILEKKEEEKREREQYKNGEVGIGLGADDNDY